MNDTVVVDVVLVNPWDTWINASFDYGSMRGILHAPNGTTVFAFGTVILTAFNRTITYKAGPQDDFGFNIPPTGERPLMRPSWNASSMTIHCFEPEPVSYTIPSRAACLVRTP